MTVNEQLQDALIAQDLEQQRAIAGLNKEVDAILQRLSAKLQALQRRFDPWSETNTAKRAARQRGLLLESETVISSAYDEVAALLKDTTPAVAQYVSRQLEAAFAAL